MVVADFASYIARASPQPPRARARSFFQVVFFNWLKLLDRSVICVQVCVVCVSFLCKKPHEVVVQRMFSLAGCPINKSSFL